MELSSLRGLSHASKRVLSSAGYYNAAEVLLSSVPTISNRTSLSKQAAAQLLQEVATAVDEGTTESIADFMDLKELEDEPEAEGMEGSDVMVIQQGGRTRGEIGSSITTGDATIDSLFGLSPGVPLGSITEVCGEASCGKSHFCLQLSLTVQLPVALGGVGGGCCFISSEGHVASTRLVDMARGLIARGAGQEGGFTSEVDFMNNIHTSKAQDFETIDHLLSYHVPALIERFSTPSSSNSTTSLPPLPIKLLIIDSIAALFRGDPTSSNSSASFISRSKELAIISDKLKSLAYTHNLAILLANQVSDVFEKAPLILPSVPPQLSSANLSSPTSLPVNTPAHVRNLLPPLLYVRYQSPHFSGENMKVKKTASLGFGWANMVNTRIMMSRDESGRRRAELIFSPWAKRASVGFVLDKEGVRGLDEWE